MLLQLSTSRYCFYPVLWKYRCNSLCPYAGICMCSCVFGCEGKGKGECVNAVCIFVGAAGKGEVI